MDEELKREFDNLCNCLGLTVTGAFNVFAKTAVRRQKIPFEISMDHTNAKTMMALEDVEQIKRIRSQGSI